MDYLVKIRSVQTPLNGQFSIGANTKWLNTADKGAITLTTKDGSWLIQAMRETESKYWNNQ